MQQTIEKEECLKLQKEYKSDCEKLIQEKEQKTREILYEIDKGLELLEEYEIFKKPLKRLVFKEQISLLGCTVSGHLLVIHDGREVYRDYVETETFIYDKYDHSDFDPFGRISGPSGIRVKMKVYIEGTGVPLVPQEIRAKASELEKEIEGILKFTKTTEKASQHKEKILPVVEKITGLFQEYLTYLEQLKQK